MPPNRFMLRLFNPSDQERHGHITVDWEPISARTRLDPGKLVILGPKATPLPYQIDPVFPGKAKLSFTLSDSEKLPSVRRDDYHYDHPAAYATLESSEIQVPEPPGQRPEVIEGEKDQEGRTKGVKLRNGILDVWINLVPAPWGDDRTWFSGSATTVVLPARPENPKEFLDANYWEHDPEKRILQLDRFQLSRPAWDDATRQDVSLFDQPYDLISQSAGPVRATVTLASAPFEYTYTLPGKTGIQKLICQLFRVMSLYRGADHVLEELFVRGSPEGVLDGKEGIDLTFTASYFAYMRMRGGLLPTHFEQVPDWFAVTSGGFAAGGKFHSYGFATDVHAEPVAHPSPGHPMPDVAANTFSWKLYPCKTAKCLHLFTFWRPEDTNWPEGVNFWDNEEEVAKAARREGESRAGKAWYEYVYKPLTAKL